jgi:C-terminal processing protease CtpA/Prc
MKRTAITAVVFAILMSFSEEHLQAQEPDKAKALADGLIKGNNEISDYNTACYFSLAGNKSLALTYLRKAVRDGFDRAKVMLEDSDLDALHNETEWSSLVKMVQDNEQKKGIQDNLFFNQPGFWDSKYLHTPYQKNISQNEKVAGLSKFWSEAKYNFVNFDLVPEVNIDSLYIEYLPKVINTKSTLEYYKVLTEMCAKLKDGHTNINAPEELRNEVYARPLIRTRMIEDKVLVIEADKTIQEKGIKAGMEILMVNGLPVKEYAAKFVTPYQSSSTAQDKTVRSYEYALLSGSLTQPIQLKLKDEKGNVSSHTISRVAPAERSAKFSYVPVEYKILPGNICYLAINTFATDTGSKVFIGKYPEIANSNAIIIDLRNNGGGSTDWRILRYFIDSPVLVHKMYSRQYVPSQRAWQWAQKTWGNMDAISPNKGKLYTKPVIILTSARTFSAAEDFAAAFKSLKRGLIIGEATGGSTGQPLGISLPGNLTARICTKRDQYPDGEDFVGKGIQPDVVVMPTVNDVRKGVDTQLEAALGELKKMK